MLQNLENPKSWHGIWTALVTPLKKTASELHIDIPSLEKIIEEQIATRSLTGLVIAGSTGEGSLLSEENYICLLREAHRIVAGRMPLVAGIGIGGTEASLSNAQHAKKLGYQAILASPPAYIKAPQRGLIRHYLALAEVGLPICIYEVAGRAASSIEVATIETLLSTSQASRFVAVKDASGNMTRASDSVKKMGNRMALLSGDDFTFQSFMTLGGNGAISVASHLVPKEMKKIYDGVLSNKIDMASAEQTRLLPLIEALFWESNPIPVKSAYFALGKIQHSVFSEPLLPMDEIKLEELLSLYKEIGDT
jgi:4-hydroxy-tetrahydrodipicolinate synthase